MPAGAGGADQLADRIPLKRGEKGRELLYDLVSRADVFCTNFTVRAIENLHNAGVDIVPVITLINGVNNEQVGSVVRFALDNPKKIPFLSFQPVSFTGRDEEITPDRRLAQCPRPRPPRHSFASGTRAGPHSTGIPAPAALEPESLGVADEPSRCSTRRRAAPMSYACTPQKNSPVARGS